MQVVILCGGQGTRIRDVADDIPKPMIPIGGRPILWHILKGYAQHGFNDFILCLGHKGWAIKGYFLDYYLSGADFGVNLNHPGQVKIHHLASQENWNVLMAETGLDSMTGCRIKRIEPYIKGDTFLLTYGDGVADVDLRGLVDFHLEHGKLGTVTAVRPPGRFGEMELAGQQVAQFNEKPNVSPGWINGGFFVFQRALFDRLRNDPTLVFEQAPLMELARDGELMAYQHTGFWHPMDSSRDYRHLNELWAQGRAPWNTWEVPPLRAAAYRAAIRRQDSLEDPELNTSFWLGKRVLVTGHTGFKGAWLCLLLKHLGVQVSGFALDPPTDPNLFQLARVNEFVDSIRGDVRDFEHLRNVMHERRPEIVLHLAAQSLVRRSYREPIETYATNVMGTVHLLEAVRQVGSVRVVINVTSDKCYQPQETIWGYREYDAMGGHDPYASSKGCAELVTSAFRQAFFATTKARELPVHLASVRAGNVIGGGDWAADRLIPDCLRACQEHRPVEIRNPTAIRPWQLVLEPLSGYLLLAERLWENSGSYAEGWNFGPHENDACTVQEIVNRLAELLGDSASWKPSRGNQPHEAPYLRLDCSKARTRLGWFPRTDLDLALRWIVSWHKRVLAGEDPRSVSMEQISQFLNAESQAVWTRPTAGFARAS